jgi:ATP-binding cassette subfamily C protein CydD
MHKHLLQQIREIRGLLALTILCGMLTIGTTIGQMSLLSNIVGRVFLAHQSLMQVMVPLLLFLGLAVVRAVLAWGREASALRAAIYVKSTLRARLFAHLLLLGPAFSKGERTGELVATLSEGIERLDAYVSRYLPQLVLSVAVPLLILVILLPLDWTSALLLLITGPIIPLLMILVGSYTEQQTQNQWLALSRMSAHFLDTLQGLTTLKLFGRSQTARARVARVSDNYRTRTMGVLRVAFLSGGVLEFMTTVAIGLVAVTLGIRLLNHGISFEQAFFVLLLTPEFYRPLRDLGTHRHAAMEGKAALQRIAEILALPVTTRDEPPRNPSSSDLLPRSKVQFMPKGHPEQHPQDTAIGGMTKPQETARPHIEVTLTNLTYTYPNQEVPALENITLTLPPHTCTALVGRSGAGKSTLANLLLRFIEPTGGNISVSNDRDSGQTASSPINTLPIETWRAQIALVSQRPYLFYGTVRDNIRLARPTASDEAINDAAEAAGALDFIRELPQSFETEVGEQGLRLSAGQAQRVAIARAFLKDAPLLILDEPTSSLDPASESVIRRALERLMQERTVLLIAHRYNTIAAADQVAVLEHGRLLESGPPSELLRAGGAYAHLLSTRREAQTQP